MSFLVTGQTQREQTFVLSHSKGEKWLHFLESCSRVVAGSVLVQLLVACGKLVSIRAAPALKAEYGKEKID